MSWTDVGNIISKAAPLLGGLVGGPIGAGLGSILSSVFGCDDNPDAIQKALLDSPDAFIKLKEIETTHFQELTKMKLEAESANLAQINMTMREELKTQSIFKSGWRPFIGWAIGGSFILLILSTIIVWVASGFVSAEHVRAMSAMTPDIYKNMIGLMETAFVVLGVNITARSYDKSKAKGSSGILDKVKSIFK